MHAQLQRLEGPEGGFRFCAALNAIPLSCLEYPGRETLFEPAAFLQAIELTSEMLISPIEVSTETLSPSELQEYYYSHMDSMAIKLGACARGPPSVCCAMSGADMRAATPGQAPRGLRQTGRQRTLTRSNPRCPCSASPVLTSAVLLLLLPGAGQGHPEVGARPSCGAPCRLAYAPRRLSCERLPVASRR
eukprot:45739-Rhodomonas_salina.1